MIMSKTLLLTANYIHASYFWENLVILSNIVKLTLFERDSKAENAQTTDGKLNNQIQLLGFKENRTWGHFQFRNHLTMILVRSFLKICFCSLALVWTPWDSAMWIEKLIRIMLGSLIKIFQCIFYMFCKILHFLTIIVCNAVLIY